MYAVSIVTRLLNEGLLDLATGDLVQAHNDPSFLNKELKFWEATAIAEFKTSHTSNTFRDKVPLRTTCKRLKRLYKECKEKSVRAMQTASLMYQVGFILPKSEILNQAWSIFASGYSPEIGGKVVEYKECLKELRKHIKAARATSVDGYYVYCKEYLDKVERWASVVPSKNNGFLVYAYTSKTNTYILTDAFIREGDNWLNAYGAMSHGGTASRETVRKHGIPIDIGKFNVKNRDSRIVIPFNHNDPKLDDLTADWCRYWGAFHPNAFASTMTSEQAQIAKFQAAIIKAYGYIDTRFNEVIKELISAKGRTLALRNGDSVQERAALRKQIVKENAESEREAYSKYERKAKKHGEKVGLKYYKLFRQLGEANQKRLNDFTNETSVILFKHEEKAKRVIHKKLSNLITVKDNMTEAEALDIYMQRLSFIYRHTSSAYDGNIETVNKHSAKLKRYEKLVRETNASLKEVKTDRKHRELTKLLNKYTRLRTKYRECLKNMEVQVDASRRQLQHAEAAVTTLKLANKNVDWISADVSPKTQRIKLAKMFEVTPTGIICVTVNKHGNMKNGVKKKLQTIGFTV